MNFFKKHQIILLLIVLVLRFSSFSFANQIDRRLQEEKRISLQQAELRPIYQAPRLLMEYGGWLNYQFIDYDNYDNDAASLDGLNHVHSADLRFWLKATLMPKETSLSETEHSLYLRFKDYYAEKRGANPGEAFDHDGPHLDYAYVTSVMNLFRFEVGRRYFNMGKGIAYSSVHDGMQLNYLKPGWNVGLLASHTLPHEDNVDTSVPGYDKNSDRYFYGLGVGYAKIKNRQLYGYLLVQRDESNQRPENSSQHFDYQSEYLGLGINGKVTPSLKYWVEVIKQTGTSRVFGSNEKKNIEAWAMDAEVNYRPNILFNPRFSFEYAFGSGDADRVNVTDTEFGNTSGDDENFQYFGYLSTGFALAPRLSNLHMIRCSVEINPFEKSKRFKELLVGVDYYEFYKHRKAGGISDLEASVSAPHIGSEIDFFLEWPLLSDCDLNVQFGHFMPADAYDASANSSENFLLVSLIHTF